MSIFLGNDKEIDFEEEDTRNQYPDLYETEKEEDRRDHEREFTQHMAEWRYEREAREQEEDTAL